MFLFVVTVKPIGQEYVKREGHSVELCIEICTLFCSLFLMCFFLPDVFLSFSLLSLPSPLTPPYFFSHARSSNTPLSCMSHSPISRLLAFS